MTPRGLKYAEFRDDASGEGVTRRTATPHLDRRHPDAPRFLQRGEGSGVVLILLIRHSLCRTPQ
jgi:hypothetical protein